MYTFYIFPPLKIRNSNTTVSSIVKTPYLFKTLWSNKHLTDHPFPHQTQGNPQATFNTCHPVSMHGFPRSYS